jgi:hypothetical protein
VFFRTSVSFRVVTPGGGGGAEWGLRRGGHQTSKQNFLRPFFLLISPISSQPSHSSLRPSSPLPSFPSSRPPAHTNTTKTLFFSPTAAQSVWSLFQSPKKNFLKFLRGAQRFARGSLPPPLPRANA